MMWRRMNTRFVLNVIFSCFSVSFALAPCPALAMLDHDKITLIEQQANFPELTESVAPTPGNPWTWTASGFSGFNAAPSIWFDYQDTDHTIARLHWSGFVSQDWQNGVNGSFTLTLSNSVDSDRIYTISLSLRSLVGNGYTMFKQQTDGGAGFTAAGAEGFVMIPTGSAALPGDLSLTFDAMGAVVSCASALTFMKNGETTQMILSKAFLSWAE